MRSSLVIGSGFGGIASALRLRSLGFEVVSVEADGFGPGLDRCAMRLDASAWSPPGTG